ncbi:MAG: NAD(P)H-dependent glycerol-3-phosphate dehydrogenase [Acidobacteriota bacterium]
MKLTILGAGSWGTALAAHFAGAGHEVMLWCRRPELAEELRRERRNAQFLPRTELPASLRVTADLNETLAADAVLVVVPSHGYREVVRRYLRCVASTETRGESVTLISATKGVETDTLERMSEVSRDEAAAADREIRFAVLSGPNFAVELAAGAPTSAVVAADSEEVATRLRERLSTPTFRLYSSTDVVGVELGAASKNVIAIAAGIVAGLELGHNALAALMTRGLHEITRLVLAYGGQPRTLSGLAGMGDLVLTCTGPLSRNRSLGVKLAAGETLEAISAGTPMVAEGVRNSLAIARLAEQRQVEMPITEQMVEILYRDKPPTQAVRDLMARELRPEAEL